MRTENQSAQAPTRPVNMPPVRGEFKRPAFSKAHTDCLVSVRSLLAQAPAAPLVDDLPGDVMPAEGEPTSRRDRLSDTLPRRLPSKNQPAPILLSQSQLQAVTQIHEAVVSLGQMISTINHLSALHRLPVREIGGAEVGFLVHELGGIVMDHNIAAARGRNAARRVAA